MAADAKGLHGLYKHHRLRGPVRVMAADAARLLDRRMRVLARRDLLAHRFVTAHAEVLAIVGFKQLRLRREMRLMTRAAPGLDRAVDVLGRELLADLPMAADAKAGSGLLEQFRKRPAVGVVT